MEQFGFQNLKVRHTAIDFADCMMDIAGKDMPEHKYRRLKEQIESASVSVSSNIAEGEGRWSKKNLYIIFISHANHYLSLYLF